MSTTLRALHVYKDVYPPIVGGIERHIDALRRSMPGVSSDVLVASRDRRTRIRASEGGVEVEVGQLGRLMSAPIVPTFPLWIRRFEPDVIHVHMPNPTGEAATLLAGRARIPLVVSYHADIVRQAHFAPLYEPLARRCLRRAAAVVTGSQGIWRDSRLLARHEDRKHVLPYSVDITRFDPESVLPERRAAIREKYGTPLVVAAGRLVYYKRFERLIDAAAQIDGHLVIAGAGPLEDMLRERARGKANVTLTGSVSDGDLQALLAAADCFVMTSDSRAESFGIATLEAQAMGLPCVVVDTGSGTSESVADGITGLVVPNDEGIDRVIEATNGLLRDAELRARMSAAARARVVEHFSDERLGAAMAELYRSIL